MLLSARYVIICACALSASDTRCSGYKPAKLFWLELVMKKSKMLNVYIELIRVLSSQALAKPGREEKERHGKTLFCSLHGWREPLD